jgi:hypothetical protein
VSFQWAHWPQCLPLFLHVPYPVEDADNNSSDEDTVLFNHSNEDINIFICKHLDGIKHCILHEEERAAINQSDRMSSDPPLCNFVLLIFSFH